MSPSNTLLAARMQTLLLAGLALSASLLARPADADDHSGVPQVVEAVAPTVVTVSVLFSTDGKERTTTDLSDAVYIVRPGSGTIVGGDGLILTNAHLVAEAVEADGSPRGDHWILVTLSNGSQHLAEVLARDEHTDLGLLKIQAGSARLRAMPLGQPRQLARGERVLAFSHSSGSDDNAFAGVLAFPGGPTQLREATLSEEEMLLSDARFHDTLDGGPLVDLSGRLLGVHNSSHVTPPRAAFGEEEDEEGEPKPDTDYAVIVSADAVRAAFGRWLPKDLPPVLVEVDDPREAVHAIAAISPSVVSVWTGEAESHPRTPDPADPHAQRIPATLGSGVVIDASGFVLTSSSLFPTDVTRASVRLATGETYRAELLARRSDNKTALLQLELPEGIELTPATLADSRAALAGELITVVGRPFEEPILSSGVLSALEREGFLQVATWVHRGHMGGALVDRNGRLLGIACDQPEDAGRIESSSYLGFAAPLATLLEAFEKELAPRAVASPVAYDEEQTQARRTAAVEVVERTRSSLVNVLVSVAAPVEEGGFNPFGEPERSFSLLGQGSGVIVDASGLAITNWHVVGPVAKPGAADNHLVEVTLPTGERYVAKVLSTSRDDDLALIELQLPPGEELVPVELGDSDALVVGQSVFAIGNPLGLANSVSAGIVSCKELDAQIQGRLREYKGLVMTDAAINPGNSGGALLDEHARLVGINSAGRIGAGMAIPVNRAREVFSGKLLTAEQLRSASFGFLVEERDGALFVTSIEADGPAGETGLAVGDQLLAIDGRETLDAVGFARAQRTAQPGQVLTLRIGRDGEELEVALAPVSYAAWRIFSQSGALLSELDYAAESEGIHAASLALHRAYSGDPNGRPAQLMSGALRVERVHSIVSGSDHPLRAGDLLLGIGSYVHGATTDSQHLIRLESLADLTPILDERATKDGQWCECWVLRDGEVVTERVWVRRPPR